MKLFVLYLGFITLPVFAQQAIASSEVVPASTTTAVSATVAPEILYTPKPSTAESTECATPSTSQTALQQQVTKAQQALATCQQKQRQHAVLKDFFEQALHKQKENDNRVNTIVNSVFNVLHEQLPDASYYQLTGHKLVIATDAILVPGRGEVSIKGQTRLQLMANALRAASALIPADAEWFWRITGHADNQPLRRINWFPSNWELSAARAAAVLRYFIDQGLSADHLALAAFGNTRLLVPDAADKAGHARNRRVVIELVIQ